MILVNGRKLNVLNSEKYIGFNGDNLVETRHFKITDPSIFDMDFRADIGNTNETVYLEKDMRDDCIVLSMPITAAMVKNTPVLYYQLRGIEADGDRVWHSEKSTFYCETSYDADREPARLELDEFHTLEQLAQQHCNEAEQHSEYAEQMKDAVDQASLEMLNVIAQCANHSNAAQTAADQAVSAKDEAVSAKESALEIITKCNADYQALKSEVYTKSETDAAIKASDEALKSVVEEFINEHGAYIEEEFYHKNETDALLNNKANKFDLARVEFEVLGLPTYNDVYTKTEIDTKIGDIDTALDELHTYAQALIGGDA